MVGYVQLNGTGRKNKVLCGWRPQSDTLEHEVALTDICLALGGDCVRGPKTKKRCDAQIVLNNTEYLVEFCTGSMGLKSVESQWATKYAGCENTVLVVTVDEPRRKQLLEVLSRIDAAMYVGLLDDVVRDPFGAIWLDADGAVAAVEKPCD